MSAHDPSGEPDAERGWQVAASGPVGEPNGRMTAGHTEAH